MTTNHRSHPLAPQSSVPSSKSRGAKALSAAVAACAVLTLGPAVAGASTSEYDGPADSLPPSIPTGVTVTSAEEGKLLVDWEPSIDDTSGVRSYLVYVDGAYRTWTYDTKVHVTAGSSSSIQLRATDFADNRSAKTSSYSLSGSDSTNPTTPTGLQSERLADGRYRLTWTPSEDDSSVRSYLVYVNGAYKTWSPDAETVLTVPAGGRWNVEVRAVDSSGNRSDKSDTLVVGDTPKDVTPPTAPTDVTLIGARVFENSQSWWIRWTPATDDSGVNKYEFYVNGKFRSSFSALADTDRQFVSVTNTELEGESVLIEIRAVDIHGNVGPAGRLEVEPT